ncbi:dinitrogenase iron-molybdenum cofactor biosynthesis protein [Geothermobacter hydrogeniphilus]|uniref:Dinitrogenase iron-molybdenum cofactor biosynthesis protein n=1 Tax=Geothermobacter hydrogeniphilus TaxID=1969733 RepID=A0A2K2H6U0_9BACT|nr:NifB/NifX family molybdenum-iron cluster-binding protein [Geothermobacter hydrogeniphilus]PNU18943.1 dinitrogenase iron-molybdenum cofactor biosynthesis protein [Geothermobacter hydrogeniphilus]
MLIAVASKSGTEVDQHFGHAERFLIYDYGGGSPAPVKEVQVDKYCSYDPNHPFRHPQFNAIVNALAGCKAVVAAMIGELPKQELEKVGIKPLVAGGTIADALKLAHDSVCTGNCSGKRRQEGSCSHA